MRFLSLLLFLVVVGVTAVEAQDTPTPYPTATFTPTITPSPTPDVFTVVTLVAPGGDVHEGFISNTVTTGDIGIMMLLFALLLFSVLEFVERWWRPKQF